MGLNYIFIIKFLIYDFFKFILGDHYNISSDIYSLGLIFFELFTIFETQMEKSFHFQNLRKKNPVLPDVKKNLFLYKYKL